VRFDQLSAKASQLEKETEPSSKRPAPISRSPWAAKQDESSPSPVVEPHRRQKRPFWGDPDSRRAEARSGPRSSKPARSGEFWPRRRAPYESLGRGGSRGDRPRPKSRSEQIPGAALGFNVAEPPSFFRTPGKAEIQRTAGRKVLQRVGDILQRGQRQNTSRFASRGHHRQRPRIPRHS